MPRSINGFGTSFHGGWAPIRWRKPIAFSYPADHDAVECAVALGFPLWPFKAYHTFGWTPEGCRALRIRRTPALLLRAMLRPYLLALAWPSGVFLALLAAIVAVGPAVFGRPVNPKPEFWPMLSGVLGIFAVGCAGLTLLRWQTSRSRDIRLIMGPHERGTSDPVLWLIRPDAGLAEACAYEGARQALQEGRFAKAMFSARVLAALGDAHGESLTEEILADPRLQPVLPELRRRPWRRPELLPDDDSLRVSLEEAAFMAPGGADWIETQASRLWTRSGGT